MIKQKITKNTTPVILRIYPKNLFKSILMKLKSIGELINKIQSRFLGKKEGQNNSLNFNNLSTVHYSLNPNSFLKTKDYKLKPTSSKSLSFFSSNNLKPTHYSLNPKSSFAGFTLAELIVVISILAILSTIAFISFKNYTSQARDTKRISNLSTVYLGFAQNIATGKPIITTLTSSGPNLVLSGSSLTMTGYYGDWNDKLLISIGVSGNDLIGNDGFQTYKYSYFPTNNKYQVMALLENNPLAFENSKLFQNTFADSSSGGYVYIKGNFASTGGIVGLIPKPLSWETNSGNPKVLDGSGEVLKTGDLSDIDPLASLPKGNVSGYAWSEGFGYIDFGYISINNTTFSGTVWSESSGWMSFASTTPNTLTLSWISGIRKFDGYIWSEGLGWINFNTDVTNRVYIGADSYWKGKAWSENGGWINFSSGTVH